MPGHHLLGSKLQEAEQEPKIDKICEYFAQHSHYYTADEVRQAYSGREARLQELKQLNNAYTAIAIPAAAIALVTVPMTVKNVADSVESRDTEVLDPLTLTAAVTSAFLLKGSVKAFREINRHVKTAVERHQASPSP